MDPNRSEILGSCFSILMKPEKTSVNNQQTFFFNFGQFKATLCGSASNATKVNKCGVCVRLVFIDLPLTAWFVVDFLPLLVWCHASASSSSESSYYSYSPAAHAYFRCGGGPTEQREVWHCLWDNSKQAQHLLTSIKKTSRRNVSI